VGDLLGATRAALAVPDATVLCLCGRNDKLRARVARHLGDEPRLRLMGFTDRMGDVLAASDALVHSSAGLTVLEAIIRGCPVISYGFGYGHVKASNRALERFGLAQVVRDERDLGPALDRALAHRPEPDPSFARRPSTASLMLSNERRVAPLPRWRLRAARAATASAATLLVAAWTLTTGASYSLVSQFVHMRAITSVPVSRPEVGLLLDVPATDIPTLAGALRRHHMDASFAVSRVPTAAELSRLRRGDQAIPQLGGGGLVRWLETGDQLHRLTRPLGFASHRGFLYASSGPSVGQWWLAHNSGGRLVGGAVRLSDIADATTRYRQGEVIEVSVPNPQTALVVLDRLCHRLRQEHLHAVSLFRLWHDAGVSV
jgi:hypothetical protein